jgi:hypothetical protein
MHAVRHAEGFAKKLVQCWTTYVDCASCLPCEADLRSNLLLTSLGGIEAAGDEEQVLHGGFAGPRAQYSGGFASFRLTTYEGAKDLVPSITRGSTVGGGVQDFDAIAGTDVEDLGHTETLP